MSKEGSQELRQRVTIKASPKKVFEALIDSRKHSAFTGQPAKFSRKLGSPFTCYGGYTSGRVLELVPSRLIVLAWRSKHWPRETYSIVSFRLSKLSHGRTQLLFEQIGVPEGDCQDEAKGWDHYYWQPLKRYLEK